MREGGNGQAIAPGTGSLGMGNWSAAGAERGRRAHMIEIVGIGPFRGELAGDQGDGRPAGDPCLAGGPVIATLDAFVWSELGAGDAKGGGTYVFLREGVRAGKMGTADVVPVCVATFIQAPLSVAFGFDWVRTIRELFASTHKMGSEGNFRRAWCCC